MLRRFGDLEVQPAGESKVVVACLADDLQRAPRAELARPFELEEPLVHDRLVVVGGRREMSEALEDGLALEPEVRELWPRLGERWKVGEPRQLVGRRRRGEQAECEEGAGGAAHAAGRYAIR